MYAVKIPFFAEESTENTIVKKPEPCSEKTELKMGDYIFKSSNFQIPKSPIT